MCGVVCRFFHPPCYCYVMIHTNLNLLMEIAAPGSEVLINAKWATFLEKVVNFTPNYLDN